MEKLRKTNARRTTEAAQEYDRHLHKTLECSIFLGAPMIVEKTATPVVNQGKISTKSKLPPLASSKVTLLPEICVNPPLLSIVSPPE